MSAQNGKTSTACPWYDHRRGIPAMNGKVRELIDHALDDAQAYCQ